MQIQGIEEKKGMNYITYTFLDYASFYEAGYKVIRANAENGYVKCNSIRYNGSIRLLYNISNLKTLSSASQSLTPNGFATLLLRILEHMEEMKKNGFVHIESVDLQPENVYVDVTNLKPYFVYVPVFLQSTLESYQMMESYLRQSIAYLIQSNPNLNKGALGRVALELANFSTSLGDIRNIIVGTIGTVETVSVEKTEETQPDGMVQETEVMFAEPYERKSGKLKKPKTDKTIPQIMLVGVDTAEKVEFVIDKDEFVIGHRENQVDGYIGFNSSVSRKHCAIRRKKEKYYIVDLKSANGTWVNGKKIGVEKEVEIGPGDKIKLSNVEFLVTGMGKGKRRQK